MGDLTADIRSSFATDALDNASQNLTRDLCAGTLVGATVEVNGVDVVVLDNLEISLSALMIFSSASALNGKEFHIQNGAYVCVRHTTISVECE